MKTTRAPTLFLALTLPPLLFLALCAPTARAADPVVLRVKVSGATSGTCGGNWATACGLQHALQDLAVPGTQVWVAAGTYIPTTDGDRTATFVLHNGVAVIGGFAGTETAVSQRNPVGNVTILSGDLNGNDTSNMAWNEPTRSDNSFHVVTGSGVTDSAMLDGFTVKGGHANDPTFPNDRGAGIYISNGSPTLASVAFSSNWAYTAGGMNVSAGSPTLTYVTFSGNQVNAYGGGMYSWGASPRLNNVVFSGNSSTGFDGGAMYNGSGGTPTLTNVTFSGNTATNGHGGGIYCSSNCSMTLTNVSFISNTAKYGGGMYNDASSPMLAKVTFSANTAEWGGGMSDSGGSPTLTDTSFSGNSATYGGGMHNSGSSPTLTNVSFISNTAGTYGGGMRNDSSNTTLTNVTFSGNKAGSYGGGMYNSSGSPTLKNVTLSGNSAAIGGAMAEVGSSNPTIRNSILWGNTASSSPQIHNDVGSVPSLNDSVVQGGYGGGTHIITADPRLGALGNYGGPTQTIPLLYGSSAIDVGDDPTCAASDQRGIPRPQGAGCDIGAFESIWVHLPLIRK